MRKFVFLIIGLTIVLLAAGCSNPQSAFDSDVEFLEKYVDVIVLEDVTGSARVAVVPQYQGRVMTSTIGGKDAPSFGWVNRDVVARGILSEQERKGTLAEHIYIFGGEDRIWFGPEGGQFSVYFAPGDPLDFDHWHVPAVIDTETYDVIENNKQSCVFKKAATLHNQSGGRFNLEIQRTIQVLDAKAIVDKLNMQIPTGVQFVGFESVNTVTNVGQEPWKKETGLVSIWILGMQKRTGGTTVVIPFKSGSDEQLGPKVKDDYFGKVPVERLIVKDNVLFFRADSVCRSKIGISPLRAMPYCGSYDESNNVLTIIWYNRPEGVIDYVNSAWELQKEPYRGDVINSYNDGPAEPGGPELGPFYELETSSPAAKLAPNEAITHIHSTMHFTGPYQQLSLISQSVLGVSLDQIKEAFK